MKTKILTVSACVFAVLACVSCGEKESPKPQRSAEEVNTVDEEMTEKGKAVWYEANSKMTFANNGMYREYTVRCNRFEDMLSANDSAENLYEYKYNSDGLMLESTDTENGITKVYTYDEHSEVIGEIVYFNGEDMSQSRYENEYDENGELILQRQFNKVYDDSGDEMLMSTTEFEYDSGRLISKTIKDETEEGGTTTNVEYEYDNKGNSVSETRTNTDPMHDITSVSTMYSTYNSHGLPEKQEIYADGELSMTYEYEYTFYD